MGFNKTTSGNLFIHPEWRASSGFSVGTCVTDGGGDARSGWGEVWINNTCVFGGNAEELVPALIGEVGDARHPMSMSSNRYLVPRLAPNVTVDALNASDPPITLAVAQEQGRDLGSVVSSTPSNDVLVLMAKRLLGFDHQRHKSDDEDEEDSVFVWCAAAQCAHSQLRRAALDLVRHFYIQSGSLPRLVFDTDSLAPETLSRLTAQHAGGGVILGNSDAHLLHTTSTPLLLPGQHTVRVLSVNRSSTVIVAAGGTPTDTMYSCYTLLEHLGVRFRINEDIVSDHLRNAFTSTELLQRLRSLRGATLMPSFAVRGLQPFHDFSAGPDWWNEQEYSLLFEQMGKMKMNFCESKALPAHRILVSSNHCC